MRYEELLDELGVDVGNIVGQQMYTRCPIHQGSHYNFGVNLETGAWICFRGCGQGGIVGLVQEVEDCSHVAALSRVRAYDSHVLVPLVTDVELMKILEPVESTWAGEIYFIRPTENRTEDRWPNWWPDRGFDAEDWRAWRCQMDTNNGDVIMPVDDRFSVVVGEVIRRMPGVLPKYLNSEGLPKSELLFGESHARILAERSGLPVVVSEGPLDAIWLWHCGLAGVALFGSHMSRSQAERLRKVATSGIILALDNDEAGARGTSHALDNLVTAGDVRVARLPDDVNDIQDVRNPDDLRAIIGQAVGGVQYLLED